MRFRAKTDVSHKGITAAYRAAGWPFLDVSRHAGLGCDLVTRHRDGYPVFLEIKRPDGPPSGKALTDSERRLQALFPQFFKVAETPEQAFRAVGLRV